MTKVTAVAMGSAILGALLALSVYRVPSVHAQGGLVRVERANIGGETYLIGTEVVGFSCAGAGTGGSTEVQCFLAVK